MGGIVEKKNNMSVIMSTRRRSTRTRKKVVVFEPQEILRSQGTGSRRLLSSAKVTKTQPEKTEREIRAALKKRTAPLIAKVIYQQTTVYVFIV